MDCNFAYLVQKVIAAKGNKKLIDSLLRPIFEDSRRLQHLENTNNGLYLLDDGEEDGTPKVDAAWLLCTPNWVKEDATLRMYIDDDMKYRNT